MTRSEWVSRVAIWPGLRRSFSCSRALTSSTVEKNRTRLRWCSIACTPIAVARWVFPRAGAADEDDVVSVLQELAAMKLVYERLVDLAAREVEAGEVAIVRESGGLELVGR